MKKTILLSLLLLSFIGVEAQTKPLSVTNVKLTDKQVIAMSMKLDSLANVLSNTTLPANFVKGFTISLYSVADPIFTEVRKAVQDSLKKAPKTGK